MLTSTFGLKFGSLSPAMALKIRSRSPKPNQLFIMSQCYILANLVKIHSPVHEISCPADADANTDANRIRTINNMSPSSSVGNIINGNFQFSHCLWKFKVAIATKVLKQRQQKQYFYTTKINIFIEANTTNNSAMFQHYPPYSF